MLSVSVFRDRDHWNRILNQFGAWDFGHSYEFHVLSERNGEGSPILFATYDENNQLVMIWPGLIREVSNTLLFDMTSVYGYSGPILGNTGIREECLRAVFDRMHEIGIVDVFSRMHPIFGSEIAASTDNFIESGSIVLIDLKNQNATLSSYGAGLRYDIKRLRHSGVHVEIDRKCQYLNEFHEIYIEAMRNLDADDYYFFSYDYFEELTKIKSSEIFFIFAKHEGLRIGAGLFVITNQIMQYYLGGAVAEFKKLSPLKIVLEAAHQLAIDRGLRYFILGGGVGSERDDLFRFKARFGKTVVPFYLLKKIIDAEEYIHICREKGLEPDRDGFFPSYRAPFTDEP